MEVTIGLTVGLIYITRPTKDEDIGASSVLQSTSRDENNSTFILKVQQLQ